MAKTVFIPIFAIVIAIPLAACADRARTELALSTAAPQRPPNPELDLGPWEKPSRPEIETPEPARLQPIFPKENEGKVKLLRRYRIKYDEALLEGACSRTAHFVYDVNRWGEPIRVYLVESSGSVSFDRAAEQTLRSWRYERIADHEPDGYRKNLYTVFTVRKHDCQETSR